MLVKKKKPKQLRLQAGVIWSWSFLLIISQSFNYQLLSVFHWLEILLLPFLTLILLLQVGLDGFVLCIEVAHILVGDQTRETTQHISYCVNEVLFSLLEFYTSCFSLTYYGHLSQYLQAQDLWPHTCVAAGRFWSLCLCWCQFCSDRPVCCLRLCSLHMSHRYLKK